MNRIRVASQYLRRATLSYQRRPKSTVQITGPFTWKSGVLFCATGAGLYWYLRRERERMIRIRHAEENKGIGKPKVGGSFGLIDHNGKEVRDTDFRGRYMLVYFGFTMCPDICPEELDKMAVILEDLRQSNVDIQPIFITCDPARDDPQKLKHYLADFHPAILGLTGAYEDIKETCKKYRVYFSTPPNVQPGQDYLVDHSIFFYLMDPNGQFVDALGRQYTAKQATERIKEYIGDWSSNKATKAK